MLRLPVDLFELFSRHTDIAESTLGVELSFFNGLLLFLQIDRYLYYRLTETKIKMCEIILFKRRVNIRFKRRFTKNCRFDEKTFSVDFSVSLYSLQGSVGPGLC
jgi:hypothetical protein